jgi:hypothetical protein
MPNGSQEMVAQPAANSATTTRRSRSVRHSSALGIDQESIDGDGHRRVMMEATPTSPFEVTEPDLLFELEIIALDAPA